MKYQVKWTSGFKRDYKHVKKRGYNMDLIDEVIMLLAKGDEQERLVEEYGDHALQHNWRELHILSDWLLVYYIRENQLVLSLIATGTHSDIFNK